jgi:hypothetical protein
MLIDVSISTALAILAIVMAYLGVHITMYTPDSPRKKLWFKIGFCSCATVTISLVIWQGIRNSKVQAFLQTQIAEFQKKIAHAHINFDTNAILIATENVQRTMIPSTMAEVFSANGKAEFNVDYRNVGLSTANRTGGATTVIITDTRPNLDKWFAMLRSEFTVGWRGSDLVAQDHRFMTAYSRRLSSEDIARLDHGRLGLYLVAVVRFSDSTGDYEQDFCGWLQLPIPSRQLVWHDCGSEYGSEIKLSR